jgi:hypothetical protein
MPLLESATDDSLTTSESASQLQIHISESNAAVANNDAAAFTAMLSMLDEWLDPTKVFWLVTEPLADSSWIINQLVQTFHPQTMPS